VTKEEAAKLPKYTPNPIFAGLPKILKDPDSYYKVQKALIETLACPTTHSDPAEMQKCSTCTENMVDRRKLMHKLGFSSLHQYMEWRKVMELMLGISKKKPIHGINKGD
jgi:hypothetical protein